MPYLDEIKKKRLERIICEIITTDICTVGEINYLCTKIIQKYLNKRGISYQVCNDIVGALECCKLEFTRRVVSPYENKKRELNGDVY